jgi:single-strand DNA-binding protein
MINSVTLTGRLTADPDAREIAGDRRLCTFRLAVERLGPKPRPVDFIPVECWNGLARTVAEHLRKGRLVGVVGSLRQDRWTTPEGEGRSRYFVYAYAVHFLDARGVEPPDDEVTPGNPVAPVTSADRDHVSVR